jgi:hypothetical protein
VAKKTSRKIHTKSGKKNEQIEKKSPKKVSKKSLQKKAPLERFFSKTFFGFPILDILKIVHLANLKKLL